MQNKKNRPTDQYTNERKTFERAADDLRMIRSGAAESGYHAPTEQDIEDLTKDHSTASGPGRLNADEEIRRDSVNNSTLSSSMEDSPEEERADA